MDIFAAAVAMGTEDLLHHQLHGEIFSNWPVRGNGQLKRSHNDSPDEQVVRSSLGKMHVTDIRQGI